MPAILDRTPVFTLWSKTDGHWYLLDTSLSKAQLELKAESLSRVFTGKQFLVVLGTDMPSV